MSSKEWWTEERLARLRELHRRGVIASKIAEILGISWRSVVHAMRSERLNGKQYIPTEYSPALMNFVNSRHVCQWIYGEGVHRRYCGEPVKADGLPYCAKHHKKAYVTWKQFKKRNGLDKKAPGGDNAHHFNDRRLYADDTPARERSTDRDAGSGGSVV